MVSILSLEAEGDGASSKGSPPTGPFGEDEMIDWRGFTLFKVKVDAFSF